MMGEFDALREPVRWETDGEGLRVTRGNRVDRMCWGEITRAGLVQVSGPQAQDFPLNILPGLGRLFDLNQSLAQDYRQLVLARGRSPSRALRLSVPDGDPGAAALVEELRARLGERWIGEMPMERHMKALGLRTPWWFYPLFVVGFVVFGLLVILAMGAFAALTAGEVVDVPLVAWLALLFWVVLVSGILLLYRRYG